jgi:hypothetical protein
MSHRALKPLDGFGIALDENFNAAILQISHPSAQAFAESGRFCEEPESDALHAPVD